MEYKLIKQFNPGDRFLSLYVYKFPLGNCGGITDELGRQPIYIPNPEGPFTYDKFKEDEHRIFIPEQRGPNYWALIPLQQPIGLVGPMAGGNLAHTSDSRDSRVYNIHDRFESQETYDALSR